MKFALPMPPSLNHLFPGNGKQRWISKEYSAWKKEAGQHLLLQRARPVIGPVEITITIKDAGRFDLDGKIKATLDLLVAHGIIDGDGRKTVRRIVTEWGNVDGATVEIWPASIAARSAA